MLVAEDNVKQEKEVSSKLKIVLVLSIQKAYRLWFERVMVWRKRAF